MEQKQAALLSAPDELESRISEKYDPLTEEVENLKLEENELKELHSAVQQEESPLLFLEKLQGLQALRQSSSQSPRPCRWSRARGRCCRTRLELKPGRAPELRRAGKGPRAASALRDASPCAHPGLACVGLAQGNLNWSHPCSSGNSCCGFMRIPASPCRTKHESCAALLPWPWSCAGEFFLTAWVRLET